MTIVKQARQPFDSSGIPEGMCPIATKLTTMLPGDWRAERPVVERDACVMCGTCWLFCPVQCITEKGAWFEADLRVCKGCGICAYECPHRAITMVEENK